MPSKRKKKKPKLIYQALRNTWTRNPATQVLANRREYSRQKEKKAAKDQMDSLLFLLCQRRQFRNLCV